MMGQGNMGVSSDTSLGNSAMSSIEMIESRVQQERKTRRRSERRAKLIYPALMSVLLLAIWEVGVQFLNIPRYLFPAPSAILQSGINNGALLLQSTWTTAIEIAFGYLLSILVGVLLAFAIFQWPVFEKSVYPILISTQAMPKVAVAPLFIVWFGFGLLPKVLIAFLIAFFPIVINTAVGLSSIEREKIYLARSMGLSAFQTFRLIRLPNALPSIFAGLKISITLAVVGAVVGEFVGGDSGLGYQLLIANGNMDTPFLFAGLLALTALGVGFFSVVEVVERIIIPHQERVSGNSGIV